MRRLALVVSAVATVVPFGGPAETGARDAAVPGDGSVQIKIVAQRPDAAGAKSELGGPQ